MDCIVYSMKYLCFFCSNHIKSSWSQSLRRGDTTVSFLTLIPGVAVFLSGIAVYLFQLFPLFGGYETIAVAAFAVLVCSALFGYFYCSKDGAGTKGYTDIPEKVHDNPAYHTIPTLY